MVLPNSFRTDYGDLILNFYPEQLGDYGAEFKATDRFGVQAIGKFNLFVFENLLPVAKLKAVPSGTNSLEYLVDASESYDADANFKGGIVEYQFTIDGIFMRLKNPRLNHIFDAGSGEHKIVLQVLDNSGALSDAVSVTINVK